VKPGGHTVVKRRFLDGYSLNKLLEVYVMDEFDLPEEQDRAECAWLMKHLPEYDVVLAADFGHRGISSSMLRIMTQSAPFLAVMTQANAGNRGFNTASKYPRADYLCISEHELRLESRDSNGPLKPMMHALAQKMGCTKLAVTRGRKGCFIWDRDDRIADAPSLAANVLDRVGAGDAFLAVTSMAARQGVPADIMCFIGNVAGGLIAQTIGNMKYVDPMEMKKWIVSMMK
jgi:sugar/nucleoside kinase (ribokinase family)